MNLLDLPADIFAHMQKFSLQSLPLFYTCKQIYAHHTNPVIHVECASDLERLPLHTQALNVYVHESCANLFYDWLPTVTCSSLRCNLSLKSEHLPQQITNLECSSIVLDRETTLKNIKVDIFISSVNLHLDFLCVYKNVIIVHNINIVHLYVPFNVQILSFITCDYFTVQGAKDVINKFDMHRVFFKNEIRFIGQFECEQRIIDRVRCQVSHDHEMTKPEYAFWNLESSFIETPLIPTLIENNFIHSIIHTYKHNPLI